jgi:hypothetical protein
MTRARYLVFLPAVFRHIEDMGLARGKDPDRVSRDWQDKIRKVLAQNEPSRGAGVIGKEAGRNISRTPSIIYWSGLSALGISTRPLSEAGYIESLSDPSASKSSFRDDDRSVHDTDSDPFWDPAFRTSGIIVNGEVAPALNFALTYREARAIQDRFDANQPDDHSTLMTECIHRLHEFDSLDPQYPWDIPGLPAPLETMTKHAKVLSLMTYGATLLYHAALYKKRRLVDDACRKAFDVWYGRSVVELTRWDLDEFTALPPVIRSGAVADVPFLRALRDKAVSLRSAERTYDDAEIRAMITQREQRMRASKARLSEGQYLRLWKPPTEYADGNIYGLTYRHGIGKRFAADIAEGLRQARQ